jgi:hypothetical protein
MPVSMSNSNRPCALANSAGRKGVKWSDVETNKVLAAFEAGDTIADIATEHQRSINAIQSKLVALVVKEDPDFSKKRMDEYADALGIDVWEFGLMTNKPIETCFKFPWNDTEDAQVMEAFRSSVDIAIIAKERDRPLWEIQWRLGCALVKEDPTFQQMSKQEYAASIDMSMRYFDKIVAKFAAKAKERDIANIQADLKKARAAVVQLEAELERCFASL